MSQNKKIIKRRKGHGYLTLVVSSQTKQSSTPPSLLSATHPANLETSRWCIKYNKCKNICIIQIKIAPHPSLISKS